MEDSMQIRITQTAASVAQLMGFSMPQEADCPAARIVKPAEDRKIQRALLYNPDAIALWLYEKYHDDFIPTEEAARLTLPVRSVMPSVTPVCFASMYTGLQPAQHGIQAYVKPVLQVPTLFDAALEAGLRPVIISTAGDSISRIFLEREMDYIICKTPDECNARAEEVLRADRHDLIVVYNGNYDAWMHRYGPESEEALSQLRHNLDAYERLSRIAQAVWAGKCGMTAFLPDHGCHEIDGQLGSHGLDMEEDMNVIHFYRFYGLE